MGDRKETERKIDCTKYKNGEKKCAPRKNNKSTSIVSGTQQ